MRRFAEGVRRRRILWGLALLSAAVLAVAALAPPVVQPAGYHDFVDRRACLGVPNCLDVASNGAFLAVGAAGLAFLLRLRGAAASRVFIHGAERWAYLALFLNVAAAGAGSIYYHLAPDSERLVWDRLPIATGVTALLAAVLGERVGPRAGVSFLPALLALGAASVGYWYWGERQGAGSLNLYIVVQFYSLLLVLMLGVLFPPRYTRSGEVHAALGLYALAKLAEAGDAEIYALGQIVSGHTLKHLLAALASYRILYMLKKREPLRGGMTS